MEKNKKNLEKGIDILGHRGYNSLAGEGKDAGPEGNRSG